MPGLPQLRSRTPDTLRPPAGRIVLFVTLLTLFAIAMPGILAGSPPMRGTATTASPANPQRIVILGDSLTAGYGLDDGQSYPALLERKLINAKLDRQWMVINAGVSGDTTADGLHRLNWVLRQPVDILVIALGANDGLRGLSLKGTEQNIQAIIDQVRAKYPDVRIVIAGMLMPPNMGPEYTTAFAAIYPRVAEHNKATLIPFLLEGVAAKPELNQPDGIHPNADGAKIVTDTVWKALQPVLKTDSAPSTISSS
jgi:acyl-CoA thioesterase-1